MDVVMTLLVPADSEMYRVVITLLFMTRRYPLNNSDIMWQKMCMKYWALLNKHFCITTNLNLPIETAKMPLSTLLIINQCNI